MEQIINKISSYNLFNYLFSGIVFAVILNNFLDIKIYFESSELYMQMANLFWIYFIGLTISRIGSIIIEPIFKTFVKHASYTDYMSAEKNNPKIEILSEQNNIYRTMISVLITSFCIYIIKICDCNLCLWTKDNYQIIIIVSLLWLYIFSYVKQTRYIVKRVEKYKDGVCQQ